MRNDKISFQFFFYLFISRNSDEFIYIVIYVILVCCSEENEFFDYETFPFKLDQLSTNWNIFDVLQVGSVV